MFFLVTGASGVGKSTVRRLIEPALGGSVVACELGSLGLTPEWSLAWRQRAVELAVQRALEAQAAGKDFLLCGDPVPPGELYAAPSADGLEGIGVCLLDVSAEKQRERLSLRGDPAELVPAHVAFAEWMRGHVRDHRHRPEVIMNGGWDEMRWERWNAASVTEVPWKGRIVDTSERSVEEVAGEVLEWMKRNR